MSQLLISKSRYVFISFFCAFFIVPFFSANALTISPARLELNGDPGQVVSGEFILINEEGEDKTFYSSAQNFEAQGETGTPSFVDARDGLAAWISVPDTIVLKKGEQKKITFSVFIPADADAGGHFAAIFLTTSSPYGSAGQVSVGAKIGVLVLLRVSGFIREGGGVASFSTLDNARFFSSPPIGFTYRFTNTGNDRAHPEGNLLVRNIFGFIAGSTPANPSSGNVLPGSTRRFEVMWGEPLLSDGFFSSALYEFNNFFIGWYRTSLDLSVGSTKAEGSAFTIFIFPWQLILVVFLILSILFFGVRNYNQWIIRRAQLGK